MIIFTNGGKLLEKFCKLNVDKQLIETFYRKKFESPNLKVRCSYDSQANADEIDVIELSPDFVFSIIKSIAVDTSPGPDKVLLKSIRNPAAARIIALIGTKMLKTGIVPEALRTARTVLLFKGGAEDDLSKWRPITICSVVRRVIVKFLERIVRQYIHLNQHQRGFVMTPGTFVNLNILDGVLKKATTQKSSVCVVFLDISRAFDSIGHEHLISTIQHSILPNNMKRLLINLLQGNSTQIQTPTGRTEPINFNCGVMQGDPISPLLFTWGINHILDELTDRSVADAYGFHLTPHTDALTALWFADDLAIT